MKKWLFNLFVMGCAICVVSCQEAPKGAGELEQSQIVGRWIGISMYNFEQGGWQDITQLGEAHAYLVFTKTKQIDIKANDSLKVGSYNIEGNTIHAKVATGGVPTAPQTTVSVLVYEWVFNKAEFHFTLDGKKVRLRTKRI